MRRFKWIAVLAAIMLVMGLAMSLAGCGNNAGEDEQSDNEPQSGQEDQADIEYMDPDAIVGSYSDRVSQRAIMDISYNENEKYYEVKVQWGSSASESTEWVMTAFDHGNTKSLSYHDCSCDNLVYGEDGSFEAENVYSEGSGELAVNEDMTITWLDDNGGEHIFERY